MIIKKQSNYEVGDIITFYNDENCLITHRIIEKYKNDFFKTKGDANNTSDEKIINQDVICGKVIYTIGLRR